MSLSKRILHVTSELQRDPVGGRALLCKLNYNVLKGIHGENLLLLELPKHQISGVGSVIRSFSGHIDGIDSALIENALCMISDNNIDKVFIDGSNFGELAKVITENYPQVEVCTFFHNVESRFFLGSLRQEKTVHALAVLVVNYLAERKAVRYSDKIICLTKRDSLLLEGLYGRGAGYIAPMAVQDKVPEDFLDGSKYSAEKYQLFVGGGFYANRAGIQWFVKHVVPRITIKTIIVGRGLADLKQTLGQAGKVEIVGAVDSLADWYRNAQFVIAPIFDGSGMKTKVAESLMFGKKVIGTPEAFAGYEEIADKAGWVCTTADDFVGAIENALDVVVEGPYPELRAIYEERYSFASARTRLALILESE